jgi:hypothetical protein
VPQGSKGLVLGVSINVISVSSLSFESQQSLR